ncbi:hypothetical protein ABZU45_18930 [Streptomyces avermitilis]|uniref:hypothetical protein n=1 Tax=Streptomyces avermitilis TaxID=33903 RepID=UPI0033A67ED8
MRAAAGSLLLTGLAAAPAGGAPAAPIAQAQAYAGGCARRAGSALRHYTRRAHRTRSRGR